MLPYPFVSKTTSSMVPINPVVRIVLWLVWADVGLLMDFWKLRRAVCFYHYGIVITIRFVIVIIIFIIIILFSSVNNSLPAPTTTFAIRNNTRSVSAKNWIGQE